MMLRRAFSCRILRAGLVVAGALVSGGCSEAPPVPERAIKPVRLLEVGESLIPQKEFFGTAEASRSADLAFRFGGRVTEFLVAQGEQVEAGAVIARLDAREWETREQQVASELDGARAVLAQMRRGARAEDVARLEAVVTARKAESAEAAAQFERMDKLAAQRAVSQVERDRAKLALEVAQSSAAAAALELEVARSGARAEELEAKEAQIRGLEARLTEARNNLGDTVLKAPFAGTVSRTFVRQFEDVQGNQPVATLQDLGEIDVVIFVTEADFGKSQGKGAAADLKARTVAFAEFPALSGRRFPLRVKEFQTEADPVTQTYRIILRMEQDSSYPVKPGMNAVVRGEGTREGGAAAGFLVPAGAVWGTPEGKKSVWVVDPETSKVSARAVTTGEISGDSIAVMDGLKAGERIAVTAANLLREGMQVEPMKDLGAL